MAAAPTINPYRLFDGAFVPWWLLRRPEVSQGAKLTWCVLARRASPETGEAVVRVEDVAADVATDERQARRYLDELRDLGLVTSRRRGLGLPNVYVFPRHPWMGLDGEASVEGSGEAIPTDNLSSPDRTHMSAPDQTHMSAPERTDVSVPSSSDLRSDDPEREISQESLNGHALLFFDLAREALPRPKRAAGKGRGSGGVSDSRIRTWANRHAAEGTPEAAVRAACEAAQENDGRSLAYLDTCIENGVPEARSRSKPARQWAPEATVRDELRVTAGESFEDYARRLTGRDPASLGEGTVRRLRASYDEQADERRAA
ncbi:MAG: helix-turn-helix domain-containing protein [Candidatus Nanopelagicales bacterium]